jgi:hypothetical protein
MLLSDADYLARAGVAFDVPEHPGPPHLPLALLPLSPLPFAHTPKPSRMLLSGTIYVLR